MGGEAGERRSAPIDQSPSAGGRQSYERQGRPTGLQVAADWFAGLPRDVAVLLTIAAFLVVINLFTGPHRIWFHWPVAALLFIVVLRMVGGRRRRWDRDEKRRRDRE